MLEHRKPIPVSDAVKKVMEFVPTPQIETVSIDQSDERYLAEDIKADQDIPPFDRAPYDGFAIRSLDSLNASRNNPVEFEVIEEIGAGQISKKKVQPFQAVRIMTGALMPVECDAVVMLELTTERKVNDKSYMQIKRPFKSGENVSFQGSETQKGNVLVEKGRAINPGVKALLATFGYANVSVIKKPIIGLFATGTELLEVGDPLEPGKIRNSNAYMIASQIKRAGAEVRYYGKLVDDFDQVFNSIQTAINEVDILITTGGVSVGDYDYMPEIYKILGADILFNKIAMRPGSVTTVAQSDGKLLYGLSGNPSACFVGFELYTRPVLHAMYGSKKPHLKKVEAELVESFPKPNPFTRFVRSKVEAIGGKLTVAPSGIDKSNVVTSLADANSLMILPGGTRGYDSGDQVEVLLLEDKEGCEWPWG